MDDEIIGCFSLYTFLYFTKFFMTDTHFVYIEISKLIIK